MTSKILPIALLILAAGIAYFYIYPTYVNVIQPAQQEITTYDTALTAATQFTQNEQNLLVKSQAISASDLSKLQWYMPDSVDKIHFIDGLNHLASSYGVVLSSFAITDGTGNTTQSSVGSTTASAVPTTQASTTSSGATAAPAPQQSSGATNSLDIALSATGTYDAFQSFLTAVEESAPLLDVTQLTLRASSTGVYTYSMNIRTYWLP